MNFQSLPMNGENGLRSLATHTYGITNVKKYSKAELVILVEQAAAEGSTRTGAETVEVTPIEATTEEAIQLLHDAAAKADAAKPARKAKKLRRPCTECGIREQDTSVIGPELCTPCYEYAGWENQHGDDSHEEVLAYDSADKASGTKAPFDKKTMKQVRADVANCPVCHPELDTRGTEAQTTAVRPHAGTSRAGMRMSVSVRAAGLEKAHQILGRLENADLSGKIKTSGGVVRLVIPTAQGQITLAWSQDGPYLYDESSEIIDGKAKKVRNAKAALASLSVDV